MAFAAAHNRTANRSCINGSPPLMVNPPDMTWSPRRYFRSSSTARSSGTAMPLVSVQVSGLWQYWHRQLHPAVQATTRIPGPSTAEPVVNECRKPTSPDSIDFLMNDSFAPALWFTRSSNGLLASSGSGDGGASVLMASTPRGTSG